MSESVRITNLPDSGSPERVAYDLWNDLRGQLPDQRGTAYIANCLALFAACRKATYGSAPDLGSIK